MALGAGPIAALLLVCLASLQPCRAQELQLLPGDPLEPLLPRLQDRIGVSTAWELLQALNSSAGSTVDQLVTLTGELRGGSGQLRH